MLKVILQAAALAAGLLALGCPRFNAECVGGEWTSTVAQVNSTTSNAQAGDTTRGCKYWLCRSGYLRQDDSCVQACDADFTQSGRWCIKKCPANQWAKGNKCVESCGPNWYEKEPERQCVDWCEEGYTLSGEKCLKMEPDAASTGQSRTL